jgi:hypothetical protein
MSAPTRQDVLDENETVVGELDDGARLVKIETEQGDTRFRFEPPHESTRPIDDKTRAKLWFVLYALAEGFSTPSDPTHVPVDVALEGKPAVAAWLYAVGHDSDAVADRLGVSRKTVWDYMSRVRRRVGVRANE